MLDLRDFQYQRKYSDGYITHLIVNEGYVPVSSGAELNALRNTTYQKMGAGTIWEGDYTTGLDKKYVQVRNISLSDYQTGTGWSPIYVTNSDFHYKGNLLKIKDCKINNPTANNQALFGGGTSSRGTYEDVICENFDILGNNAASGLLTYFQANIKNCHIINSRIESKASGCGALFEQCRGGNHTIEDCSSKNNIIINQTVGAFGAVAGVCGVFANDVNSSTTLIKNITSENNYIYSITNYAGGISAFVLTSAAGRYFVFENYKSINNNIISVGNYCGGAFGSINDARCSATNGFSASKVSGGGNVGGLIGVNSGTITNSYYDSNVSGKSDTGKGLPRTTAQMLNGTADSFILANGDIDPDSLAGNAMYTGWDTNIWRFHNNKYPKIKRQ